MAVQVTPKKKRRRRQKSAPKYPPIEGDFDLQAADLSLRRPGFAQLHYCAQERRVRLVRKQILDNRSKGASEKSAPRCLKEIGDLVADWSASRSIQVFVREQAMSQYNMDFQMLQRVNGVTDYILRSTRSADWQEQAVSTIRKLVAGYGNANKAHTARALSLYVGSQIYRTDDESDAVAAGVGWLLHNGYLDAVPIPPDLPDAVFNPNACEDGQDALPAPQSTPRKEDAIS